MAALNFEKKKKEFIGVAMGINSKITVQRGGIMVYSRINWLTRSVKGRIVKALMYISTRRRGKIRKSMTEKIKREKRRRAISMLSTINLRCFSVNSSRISTNIHLLHFFACFLKKKLMISARYTFVTFNHKYLH